MPPRSVNERAFGHVCADLGTGDLAKVVATADVIRVTMSEDDPLDPDACGTELTFERRSATRCTGVDQGRNVAHDQVGRREASTLEAEQIRADSLHRGSISARTGRSAYRVG